MVICGLAAAPVLGSPLANLQAGQTGIEWQPVLADAGLTLTISGPDGFYAQQTFAPGESPYFSIFDAAGGVRSEGTYVWELRAVYTLDEGARPEPDAERGAADDSALRKTGKLPSGPTYESGSFSIVDGQIFAGGLEEPGPAAGATRNPIAEKTTISGDLTVYNSLCVGFDCPASPTYSDSTILMMENNTRIKFGDTSNAPFPNNDWEIEANSSSSGGANYLGFNDCGTADNDGGCATDLVFAVEAGARQNALYVENDGDVGFGTSNPVVNLHVVDGNTPTLRLDQDGSSGFAPQVWDVAGNETNFFVRDVTNGSLLPLRIRPGAPSSSIFIDTDGDVGIGTSSPSARLHVQRSNGTANLRVEETSGTEAERTMLTLVNNGNSAFQVEDTSADGSSWQFKVSGPSFRINKNGTGGDEIVVRDRNDGTGNATLVVNGSVQATNVTFSSSRALKSGFTPVDVQDVLTKVMALPLTEWQFKADSNGQRHLGPIAEDFHQAFGLGQSPAAISAIDASGVTMAALQGLYQVVEQKDREIQDLRSRLEEMDALLRQLTAEK